MALSGMSGSVSAKLCHYWKFEAEDGYISTNDFVHDEINSLDLSLKTTRVTSQTTPSWGHQSGIKNQNKVISKIFAGGSNKNAAHAVIACTDINGAASGLVDPDDVYKVPGTYVPAATGNGSSGVSGSFTVAGWFFAQSGSSQDDDVIFAITNKAPTSANLYNHDYGTFSIQRGVGTNNGRIYAALATNYQNTFNSSRGITLLSTANNPATIGDWNHFAFVVDSENSSGFIYINGAFDRSYGDLVYSNYNSPKSSWEFGRTGNTNTFGHGIEIYTRYYSVSGCVAEIGIFSGVLSESEISHLYNNGSGVTVASNHLNRIPVASNVYDSAVHDIKFSENFNNSSGVLFKDTIGNLDLSFNENEISPNNSDLDNVNNWWTSEISGVPHTRALSANSGFSLVDNSSFLVPAKEVYDSSQSGTMNLAHYSGAFTISMWVQINDDVLVTSKLISLAGFCETRCPSNVASFAARRFNNFAFLGSSNTFGGNYFTFVQGVGLGTSISNTNNEFVISPTDNGVARNMLPSDEATLGRWWNLVYTYDPYKSRAEIWVNGSGYGHESYFSDTITIKAPTYWGPWNKYLIDQANYVDPTGGHIGLLFAANYSYDYSIPESGYFRVSSATSVDYTRRAALPAYANYTIFNKALHPNEIKYIYNNGTGNFATIKASGSTLGNFGTYQYAATPISGSIDTEAVGAYLNQYSIATDSKTSNIGAYSNQYAISQGSSLASVGTYSFEAGILSGSVVDFKIGATMFVADLFSGTGSGSVGTNLNALSVVSNQQSSGLIGANLNALSVISNQQSSGLIGTRLIGLGVASGSSDALSIGSYAYGLGISQGSKTSNVGVYSYEAAPISGVIQNTFLGIISEQLGIPQGSKLTDIATYSYQAGPVTGSTDIGNIGTNLTQLTIPQDPTLSSLGTYLTIQQAPNLSGSFLIKRPPIAAWSWDISKNDPSGYRTIESKSSPYYPSAKKNMIGGFDAQNESGVSINFGEIPENLSSDFTSDVKCMTIQTSNASGIYFDQATSISSNIPISNTKVWLADQTDIITSGIDLKIWYKEDANWLKNTTMTSGSSGVSLFPTSEASAINLGDIGSGVSESNISNYIYMIATLPSGAYNRGGLGGLGSNWNFKVSYSIDA